MRMRKWFIRCKLKYVKGTQGYEVFGGVVVVQLFFVFMYNQTNCNGNESYFIV